MYLQKWVGTSYDIDEKLLQTILGMSKEYSPAYFENKFRICNPFVSLIKFLRTKNYAKNYLRLKVNKTKKSTRTILI